MKRVKSQCTLQTLHFMLDPTVPQELAIKKVEQELAEYKAKAGANVKILNETKLEDSSVLLEVKKKVSGYDVGDYFNE